MDIDGEDNQEDVKEQELALNIPIVHVALNIFQERFEHAVKVFHRRNDVASKLLERMQNDRNELV